MKKLITLLHGFCMALADSVPGVSGGTIAFLMGFYDNFIGSLNALISGSKQERIQAVKYLIKLGIGWVIGFCSSVLVLANVFESHIYRVSSLFIGFIIFAIPVVIYEEKKVLKDRWKMSFFVLIGMAFVVAITYANTFVGGGKDLSNPDIGMYIYAFFVGAVAICAMVLPGISGSTLLLIFGLYIPIINGIHDLLHLNLHMLPILIVFGLGHYRHHQHYQADPERPDQTPRGYGISDHRHDAGFPVLRLYGAYHAGKSAAGNGTAHVQHCVLPHRRRSDSGHAGLENALG